MAINLEVPIEEMRKRSLFLAIPMYGGMCHGNFAKSLSDLSASCALHGITLNMYLLFNESLIQRARNYCADEFMRSDCTHLMFIDADIGFAAQDVLAFLAMMSDDSPYDVLCGPYPKKTIAWEKIKAAVDKGVADQDPNVLQEFVGDFVFNPRQGTTSIRLDEPAQIEEGGTGFMMIRRAAFEKFREAFPEKNYRPDHVRTESFDGSREITAFFDCVIDPETKRYLSEDYFFCKKIWDCGGQVWLAPWIRLNHTGSFTFGGSLAALASIDASATADPSKLKGNTKPAKAKKKKG